MDAAKKDANTPDVILLMVTLILVTVGTAMIYSSSSILAMENSKTDSFSQEAFVFVFAGLVIKIA